MYSLGLRKLPYPAKSHITFEDVRKIKAIPDDDLRYTPSELEMMVRAMKDLDYMILYAERLGLSTERMVTQRKQIEETYEKYKDK